MRRIIIEPRGGLANRMRVLDSGLMFAEAVKRPVVVIWNVNRELGARFDELFGSVPNVKVINIARDKVIGKFCSYVLRVYIKLFAFKVPDSQILAWKQANLDVQDLLKHKSVYFWTWEAFWVSDRAFRDLRPVAHIKKATENIVAGDMIGIHIRRTDNVESIAQSPTQLFVDAIEQEVSNDPRVKFFLATDDAKEEEFLQKQFPNRMVLHKKQSLDRKESKAIQEAAIDLYCLARCKKIYGTYWSSFSEAAAKIGGIELVVLKNI